MATGVALQAGTLEASDVAIAVTPVYADGSQQMVLQLAAPLGEGLYQLTARSGETTGLRDPAGQALDQNRDGFGDDLVMTIDVDFTPPVEEAGSVGIGGTPADISDAQPRRASRDWPATGGWTKAPAPPRPTPAGTITTASWAAGITSRRSWRSWTRRPTWASICGPRATRASSIRTT